MTSFRKVFKFFFIAVSTIMLIATIAFNVGTTNALAATLPMPFVSQSQTQLAAKQAGSQVRNAAKNVNDQLQLQDVAEAVAKNLDDDAEAAVGNITDHQKDQTIGKTKQSGGLKGNIGWLTF